MPISHRILAALLLACVSVPAAQARVGVTSETNGDPKGKPPAEAERLLRVGIDIQADELITTKSDDRAHLVFLDGTSLTVAPNAQLKIDKFVYDPDSRKGDIAISVTTGVFRLVGGKISKSKPIVVNTPSATIGLRGGIGVFTVDLQQTKAQFLFGRSMTVSAQGHTETALRAGSEILTRSGSSPGLPGVIPPGGVATPFAALEGRGGRNDRTPDQRAQQSGFSDTNSGRGVGRTGALGPVFRPENTIDAVNTATVQQIRSAHTASAPVVTAGTPPPMPPFVPPPAAPPGNDHGCYDGTLHLRHHFHHGR